MSVNRPVAFIIPCHVDCQWENVRGSGETNLGMDGVFFACEVVTDFGTCEFAGIIFVLLG